MVGSPAPRRDRSPCRRPEASSTLRVTAAVVQVVRGGKRASAAAVVSSLALDAGSKNCPSLSAKMGEPSGVTTEIPQWARETAGSETMALIVAANADDFPLYAAGCRCCWATRGGNASRRMVRRHVDRGRVFILGRSVALKAYGLCTAR